MAVSLSELVRHLDGLLQVEQFNDYCPNGLQVEGKPEVSRVLTGVTASQALIDEAVDRGVDAIFVHHGYFWKGEDPCLVGIKRKRIAALMAHDISLLAYHLPLDEHPTLGNNAGLAARLDIQVEGRLADYSPGAVGMVGSVTECSGDEFATKLFERLERQPLHIDAARPLRRLAWCTGGGQGYIEAAVAAGVDGYLTGEVSEQTVHVARETGIHFFAAGHHATERYGASAIASHLQGELGLECEFLDIDNPA